MASEGKILYVSAAFLNVRREPHLAPDTLIDRLRHGDPVVVREDEDAFETDDGWLWHRFAEADDRWVAEFNRLTEVRLLDSEPLTEADTPDEPETLQVAGAVNVRAMPVVEPDNILERIKHPAEIQVQSDPRPVTEDGWVWRQRVAPAAGWVAEYNCRTGQRLLIRAWGDGLVDGSGGGSVVAPARGAPPSDELRTLGEDSDQISIPVKGRVQVDGRTFVLDGVPLRFVGANLRELPFYGRADVLPFARAEHRGVQLEAMQTMHMRIVRMHVCTRQVPVEDAIPRVQATLDLIQSVGMLAIVVLNDSLGSYYVPGDEPFHTHQLGHLDKQAYFVEEGYRQHYLPYVQKIVATFEDHPAIFAWELGNEYAIIPQPCGADESGAFLRFAETVSGVIRALDGTHLITTGLVHCGHVAPSAGRRRDFVARLYGLPTIDFATVHFYQDNDEERGARLDLDVVGELNKPLIVEEYGATSGNRAADTDAALDRWLNHGAAGFLQWGLSALPVDIGVGDKDRGMDPVLPGNRDHFAGVREIYRAWGERLNG
jgi:hypothetical protein